MREESLPRSWRLKRAAELTAVVRSGRRHQTPRLVLWWRTNDLEHPRVGLVIPRHGATAVARNRLRRQLREITRRHILPTLAPIDLVVRSRASAYRAQFHDLITDLETWQRSLPG